MTKEDISKVLELALEYYKLEVFGTGKEFQPPAQERIDYIYERIQPSLPSDLDEAADIAKQGYVYNEGGPFPHTTGVSFLNGFQAGAEWMAGQGWIDDGSMPPETKQESDTLQGHREWTESEPVLAWDSIYGCRVDWTRNGKWMSEQTGGYTGQVCHGIIAWRPIPKYTEKH